MSCGTSKRSSKPEIATETNLGSPSEARVCYNMQYLTDLMEKEELDENFKSEFF